MPAPEKAKTTLQISMRWVSIGLEFYPMSVWAQLLFDELPKARLLPEASQKSRVYIPPHQLESPTSDKAGKVAVYYRLPLPQAYIYAQGGTPIVFVCLATIPFYFGNLSTCEVQTVLMPSPGLGVSI